MKKIVSIVLFIISFNLIYSDSSAVRSIRLSEGGLQGGSCSLLQIKITIDLHEWDKIKPTLYDLENNRVSSFPMACHSLLVSNFPSPQGTYSPLCLRVEEGRWRIGVPVVDIYGNVVANDSLEVDFNPAIPSVTTNAVATDVSCTGCQDGKISVTRSSDLCHVWSVQLFKDFTIPYGSYQFQNGENSYMFLNLPPGPYTAKFYYFDNYHSQHGVYINEPYSADLDIAIQGQGGTDTPAILFEHFNSNIVDTAVVYLRNVTSPYDIVDSSKSALDTNGNGIFRFYNAINGTPYYIIVKHRNSIETWSSSGQIFNSNLFSFDFTTSASQAYGNNMVLVGSRYSFYSGDVNQDGVIDASDGALIDNDASSFVTGYVNTDLTGDNFVDASDASIAENNAANFVVSINPLVEFSSTKFQNP